MSRYWQKVFLIIQYVLIKILGNILFFHPKLKMRVSFEKKNYLEDGAQSFRLKGELADYCFEFSSEGEYQQVASLIDDALAEHKKIELVFFSPSVESIILELQAKYPNQIRYLRYPLASFNPFTMGQCFSYWASAKTLILVRYDLFPEFLIWSKRPGRKLRMLWMTFKKERTQTKKVSFLKMKFLKQSDKVFFATQKDLEMGEQLGLNGEVFDFRMEQIRRRVEKREQKLSSFFLALKSYREILEKYPRGSRLIIGNTWPSDLFLFEKLPHDILVLIVPHRLDSEVIETFYREFKKIGRNLKVIDKNTTEVLPGNTYLLNQKGLLCELYADFGKAYVGGGFEKSVHSILEPLISEVDKISCGPMHFRSTEFDVASELGNMREILGPDDFLHWVRLPLNEQKHYSKISSLFEKYSIYSKEVLSC